MRIILIELEVEQPIWIGIDRKIHIITNMPTLLFSLLHFDWPNGDTSLFEIGWQVGGFRFDLLFWWAIRWKLLPKISDRFCNKLTFADLRRWWKNND